jgi:hypothetical protein
MVADDEQNCGLSESCRKLIFYKGIKDGQKGERLKRPVGAAVKKGVFRICTVQH